MSRVHKQHNFKPEVPPTPNPMRWQYLPGRTFGQEVCAQCDWEAELHVHHDNWSDCIFLTLLAQHFTPVG